MTSLPEVPSGQYSYKPYAVFVNWPKGDSGIWHVFGPYSILKVGSVAEVIRYGNDGNDPEFVEILDHVASREVAKRDGSRVLYVMATFDKCVEEEDK